MAVVRAASLFPAFSWRSAMDIFLIIIIRGP
jgi:hypothetical protein